jgi:hypothetical protein
LLQTTGKEGPAADKIINALTARCDRQRAIDRLRRLQRLVGVAPAVVARGAQLENALRLRCPRCKVQLQRPAMAWHLWSEHSLVLDGRHVRKPWRLIKDWVQRYRRKGHDGWLVRARALAQQLDPEQGLIQVSRLLLIKGVDNDEARRLLYAEAAHHHASLCPHCYALVPAPKEIIPRPLNQSHGRLSLADYCVEVSEQDWVPRLRIETPDGLLYDGREPGRWLTPKGTLFALAGTLVAVALGVAAMLGLIGVPARPPVFGLLGLAWLVYLGVRLNERLRPASFDRAADYAWFVLSPRLHAPRFSLEDSGFLAGLAMCSVGRGQPDLRVPNLKRVLDLTEKAVAEAAAPLSHLAALYRLAAADAAALGRDPVPLVAAQIGRCFLGKLPITYAQWLLEEWEGSWWTGGNLARLRVLLCDRAFEAGLEVLDLLEAGHAAPALGDVLEISNTDALAQLRLLWSLRPRRPWDRCGEAVSAFELARDPEQGRRLLSRYPDLLLADQSFPAVFLCGDGVIFQDITFTAFPRVVETRARRDFDRVQYEMILGEHRLPFARDPGPWVGRLDRWFRFHFHDFLPQVTGVYAWQTPRDTRPMLFQEPVPCPECRRRLLLRVGNVGLSAGAEDAHA